MIILLDSGVVGLLCSSPMISEVAECKGWASGLANRGAQLLTPDVVDYEVRRELIRVRATAKFRRLSDLRSTFRTIEVRSHAWRTAAEFWAILRQTGLPTAHPEAIDGDAILAAVAATIGGAGDSVTIATTNVEHLARFPGIDAREWRAIT